ncbi:DNA-protecting protein DprA [Lactiplantibacillus garii]|uniref:DNA-protecting protein DprA n=1 Tax=Lactiplantibacillus garii TaxID=2306423 RepID=A0A426D8S4_9LACO|nr:DNA-processing protein DprA [Lactiplantibacillus garii]RRK10967.1 DNA-protecting protein DprA [Lactiplantibacillus garii]
MQLRSLLIRLTLVHGFSYRAITRILKHCVHQHVVVTDAGLLGTLAQLDHRHMAIFLADWQSAEFARRCTRHAALDVLTIVDADYPLGLLEGFHPPIVLFLKGNRALLAGRKLAVVGARQATPYALRCVTRLLTPLATEQLTIVSGLAAGTDGYAHQTALACGLPTIAVIGTGLDRAYPKVHADLQAQVSKAGLLMSEYPLGTGPARFRFPERNRIIAGLCQTLLVVEARERSGSLITANLALQNGRNVLAVPGPIDAPLSVGCNQLIAAGAKPVLNSRHIIEEFLPII